MDGATAEIHPDEGVQGVQGRQCSGRVFMVIFKMHFHSDFRYLLEPNQCLQVHLQCANEFGLLPEAFA